MLEQLKLYMQPQLVLPFFVFLQYDMDELIWQSVWKSSRERRTYDVLQGWKLRISMQEEEGGLPRWSILMLLSIKEPYTEGSLLAFSSPAMLWKHHDQAIHLWLLSMFGEDLTWHSSSLPSQVPLVPPSELCTNNTRGCTMLSSLTTQAVVT